MTNIQRQLFDKIFAITEKEQNLYGAEIAEVVLAVASVYLARQGLWKKDCTKLLNRIIDHPLVQTLSITK